MADQEAVVSEDGTPGSLQIERTGGRPPFEVTEDNRQLVLAMTVNGVTAEEVAETLGISQPTLRKYFMEELEHGRRNANAKVARSLYRRALKADDGKDKGAVTAAIFWLKTRAGWKEEERVEQAGPSLHIYINNLPPEQQEIAREQVRALWQTMQGQKALGSGDDEG